MIRATGIELRAGSELLLETESLRVDRGDRIGLVGRNGAGKTTLTRVLAGRASQRLEPWMVEVRWAICPRTHEVPTHTNRPVDGSSRAVDWRRWFTDSSPFAKR